jgi:hypothetical protein
MKGKQLEYSAELSARGPITKTPWHPRHQGLSYGQNPAECFAGPDRSRSSQIIVGGEGT